MATTDVGERLEGRQKLAVIGLYCFIGATALMLLCELLELAGVVSLETFEPVALASVLGLVYLANVPITIASMVLVAMWIYRAHAGLRELGHETEVSPGWAVGWYFVPLANLVMPYRSMKDLWNTSFGMYGDYASDAPGSINLWWGCWIISGMVNWQSVRFSMSGEPSTYELSVMLGAAGSALSLGAAYFLVGIVNEITRAQADGVAAEEVFA